MKVLMAMSLGTDINLTQLGITLFLIKVIALYTVNNIS